MAERKSGSSRSRAKSGTRRSATSKTTESKSSASKSSASKSKRKPAPNVNERIEGLQGWMAEIERKQDRMTKIGGGAAIVAVLASAAALALGVLGMQNSASDDDLDELRDSVNALSGEVEQQTEQQLGGLNQKITALENQVKSLQQQQQQNASTISSLQGQVGRGGGGGAGAGAGAGSGAGAVPPLPDAQP